jgi:type I pantothenate kinase
VADPLGELQALLRPGVDRCRAAQVPYVVVVTGSVAVGKSAIAQLLSESLSVASEGVRVDVVSSDGFLFPNRVLDARGLAMRKGFPESYDRDALLAFLDAVKARERGIRVPVYSHEEYDVLDEYQVVDIGDVVIVEGLHLLELSDAIDVGIYVDAAETDIEQWFVDRFLRLRSTGDSFYRQFSGFSDDEASAFARQVWDGINGLNLRECILPTRERADIVIEKGPDHSMRRLRLPRGNMQP